MAPKILREDICVLLRCHMGGNLLNLLWGTNMCSPASESADEGALLSLTRLLVFGSLAMNCQ